MNNLIIINKIYQKTISIVLKDIPNKYKDDIVKSYMEYLCKVYSKINLENKDVDKLFNLYLETEISRWKNYSLETKLSILICDDAMNQIRKISQLGYDLAEKKLLSNVISKDENKIINETINKDEANNNIKILKECLNKVEYFNKETANMSVSEGILDFKYASEDSTNLSLRLGRIAKRY